MSMSLTEQARQIAELWSEERCDWHINHEASSFSEVAYPWLVTLEWTQEGGNPHHADWATYTWQFYSDSAAEVLVFAVDWLEGLRPWKPCAECDGNGAWNGVACHECSGTGLAVTS